MTRALWYRGTALVIVSLLVLRLGVTPAAAQDIGATTSTAIDQFVAETMQELKIPGVALAVVRGDQMLYSQGYGVADAAGRAVTPQTPFLLASVSKSFTGMAIMQLVEAGKMNLDDPVQNHIPWFRPDDAPPITVGDLLYHTSGFSTYDGAVNLGNPDASDQALENNVRRVNTLPLDRSGDRFFWYSNTNYDILGYLVQVVSGQSYESYIQDHILAPLDMRHTHLAPDAARADGMSSAYYPFFGTLLTSYDIPLSRGSIPSSQIIASAEDMAHYLIAHLNSGQYGDASVLSADGVAQLHRVGFQQNLWSGYAMGLNVYPLWSAYTPQTDAVNATFPLVLEHTGAFAGFRSDVIMVPQDGWGVATLINTNYVTHESLFDTIAQGVTYMLLGYTLPPFAPYEDFLTQNIPLLAAGILILQVVRLLWSLRNLRRWQNPALRPRRARRFAAVAIPAVLDLLLIYLVAFVLPEQFDAPLLVGLQLVPDLGVLVCIALVIAVVWGVLRTILYIRELSGDTPAATPQPARG